MNLEKKQRIIGIIIIITIIIISVFIFTDRSSKKKNNVFSENDTIAVQLAETNLQQGGAPEQITGQLIENMAQPTIEYALPKRNIECIENTSINNDKKSLSPIIPVVQKNKENDNEHDIYEKKIHINLKKVEKIKNTSSIQSSHNLIYNNKSNVLENIELQQKHPYYWSIQTGSFSDYNKAQAMLNMLRSNGFNNIRIQKIFLKEQEKGIVYRVLVGHEITKNHLTLLNNKLKLLKINGYFIKNRI